MFKLVARQQAGKYAVGAVVTDAAEIEKLLASSVRKRFNKVPVHAHEVPHAPVPEQAPVIAEAPSAE